MKCAYICKASSTRKWWLQLLFYDYYFDFATPPLLPLCISTHPLFHHSPPHTPHKVLFKIDLQESTSFSLPLLAQLQTAAMSLFFKVTLIIGNVKKKKNHIGVDPGCFLKMKHWAETKGACNSVCALWQRKKFQRSPCTQKPRSLSNQGAGAWEAYQELKSQ